MSDIVAVATASIESRLVEARKHYLPLKKDKANPFYGSSYADLAATIAAVEPGLRKAELNLRQCVSGKDCITVETIIHDGAGGRVTSGEWTIPAIADLQKAGSAITYMKRYQLQGLAGIAPEDEDDDGSAAAGAVSRKESKPAYKAPEGSKPAEVKKPAVHDPESNYLRGVVEKIGEKKLSNGSTAYYITCGGMILSTFDTKAAEAATASKREDIEVEMSYTTKESGGKVYNNIVNLDLIPAEADGIDIPSDMEPF